MKVITYYKYSCDNCKSEFDTEKEAIRCEEIHGEQKNFKSAYVKRINDNKYLWDMCKTANFYTENKDFSITDSMLFLSQLEIPQSMTRLKLLMSRIKRVQKNNFVGNCKHLVTSIYVDIAKCGTMANLKSTFSVDFDVKSLIDRIYNHDYGGYYIFHSEGLSVEIGSSSNYEIQSHKGPWLSTSFSLPLDKVVTKDIYNLIIKEKLKGDLRSVRIVNDKIMAWKVDNSPGYCLN